MPHWKTSQIWYNREVDKNRIRPGNLEIKKLFQNKQKNLTWLIHRLNYRTILFREKGTIIIYITIVMCCPSTVLDFSYFSAYKYITIFKKIFKTLSSIFPRETLEKPFMTDLTTFTSSTIAYQEIYTLGYYQVVLLLIIATFNIVDLIRRLFANTTRWK